MGCSASSDEWCRRSDVAIQGVKGTQKLVDDILVSAPTEDILKQRVQEVLEGCRKAGITLSQKKMEIGTEIKFGGYIFNDKGVKPNPKNLEGISKYPAPTNVSELRSFFGMINQMDMFQPDLAHAKATVNNLLKKNNAGVWLDDHQQAFEQIKNVP